MERSTNFESRKMNKLIAGSVVAVVGIVGLSLAIAGGMFGTGNREGAREGGSQPDFLAATGNSSAEALRGMAAMDRAAAEDKYLFAMFWERENEDTSAMHKVVSAVAEASSEIESVFVQINDRAEREFVQKFRLSRAPMPLVLAIAPNGAVTGGFPYECDEQELLDAVVSPVTAQMLKSMQEGRLVFLCIQNEDTTENEAALRGVQDFAADPLVGHLADVIRVDPRDSAEAAFLEELGIPPHTSVAMTAMLVPPGALAAVIEGPTTKEALMATFRRACGPGGCSPF